MSNRSGMVSPPAAPHERPYRGAEGAALATLLRRPTSENTLERQSSQNFGELHTHELRRTPHKRSPQISSREDFTQKASSPGPMARDTPALDRGYVRSAARSLRE
jgi:hypothetical protein